MKLYLFTFFSLISISISAQQIGSLNIVDSSSASVAASKMVAADVNGDGFDDLVVSFTGSNGKTGYYLNDQNNGFSSLQWVDSTAFMTGVATGDFNNDGWVDIVSIGDTDHSVFLFLNNSGTFSGKTVIDTNVSITINDVVVDDFDDNGWDDLVVIGQHSIDYYRNMGNAVFNKEPILTTSTSPKPLECLDLEKADMDEDGDTDLICAETAGLVIYDNDGNGNFTPSYYNTSQIVWIVYPFDIDNDNDPDVLMRSSSGEVKWYSNDGSGNLTFETHLSHLPNFHSFIAKDINEDGLEDIYGSYYNHVVFYLNDTAQSFTDQLTVEVDSNLYMDELCLLDVDNNNERDIFWSGYSNLIAFHFDLLMSSKIQQGKMHSYSFFPNPATDQIQFTTDLKAPVDLGLYNSLGKKVRSYQDVVSGDILNISGLSKGIYLFCIYYNNTVYTESVYKH